MAGGGAPGGLPLIARFSRLNEVLLSGYPIPMDGNPHPRQPPFWFHSSYTSLRYMEDIRYERLMRFLSRLLDC